MTIQSLSTSRLLAFCKHLQGRGLFDVMRKIPNFPVMVSYESELVYFLLYTPAGVLAGYQRYNWNGNKLRSNDIKGRYHSYIQPEYRPVAFFGVQFIQPGKPLYVTEGAFDAIRIMQTGRQALALLTATPSKELVGYFKRITYGVKIVAIRDNDGENKVSHGLNKIADEAHTVVGAKDIGQLSVEQADSFLGEL